MKNKLLKLNNQKVLFFDQLLFLIGGFVTGLVSLVVLIFLDIFLKISWVDFVFWVILFLVVAEEILKLLVLFFLIDHSENFSIPRKALFFGMGFAFFELILIFLNLQLEFNSFKYIVILGLIHIITSLFLLLALKELKKSKILFVFYFLLAIFLHLVYNLIIIS